jgi:hypothetical protein
MDENSTGPVSSQTTERCAGDDDWRAFDVSAARYERRKKIWIEFDKGDSRIAFSLWLILGSLAFLLR